MKKKLLSINVKRDFLNKKHCMAEARRILDEKLLEGMSERQLAAEIYSHAVMYYFCEKTGKFQWLKKHADPIDLCDGGDMMPMRAAFAACWLMKRSKKV